MPNNRRKIANTDLYASAPDYRGHRHIYRADGTRVGYAIAPVGRYSTWKAYHTDESPADAFVGSLREAATVLDRRFVPDFDPAEYVADRATAHMIKTGDGNYSQAVRDVAPDLVHGDVHPRIRALAERIVAHPHSADVASIAAAVKRRFTPIR